MAFITLNSSNKKFSFELNKNPKSGLQAMELREGTLFGFFSKRAKAFNLYFQDHPLRCSFNDDLAARGDLEYNDLTRYASPLCYLSMLDKGISIKEPINQEVELPSHNYSLCITSINLGSARLVDLLKKDLQDTYTVEATPLSKQSRLFKVTFSVKATSVYPLIQVVKIFLLLSAKFSDRDQRLDDAQIEKYLKEVVRLDLNYQLRNVFKVKFLTPNLFKKNRELINTSSKVNLDLQCNNNFIQRRDFIVSTAITNYEKANIVDLGCGEGNYIKILYKKLLAANNNRKDSISYHAIDSSVDALEEVKHLARKNEFELSVYTTLQDFIEKEGNQKDKIYTYLCTEVIEHNTKEEAEALLTTLDGLRANKIVITTPNKTFNTFYNLEEEETRHHDHKHEVTEEEFKALITKSFLGKEVTFYNLGDKVNGVSSTLGAVISERETEKN